MKSEMEYKQNIMGKIILSVIGFLFFSSCFSMTNVKEKQILLFDTVVLDTLLCIDYSDVTFGEYGEIIDYNLEGKIELTEENVRKMFLGNKEVVEIRNYWTDEVVDTIVAEEYLENRTFYLQNIVSATKKWTAIIIEEIWDNSSDKYLVTIDKKQNLISKYRIALYGQFGTYTCCDEDEDGTPITFENADGNIVQNCGRCPYYTEVNGCIDKDLTIRMTGRIDNEAFIDKRGCIVKIK